MSEPKNKYMRELVTKPETSTEELIDYFKEDFVSDGAVFVTDSAEENNRMSGLVADRLQQQQEEIEELKELYSTENDTMNFLYNKIVTAKEVLKTALENPDRNYATHVTTMRKVLKDLENLND